MMLINLIAVGKLRESWLIEGCAEYLKRLSTDISFKQIEISEVKLSKNPNPKEIERGLELEAKGILKAIPKDSYTIVLDSSGLSYSSEELAERFVRLSEFGQAQLCFIIGSSFGIASSVKKQANELLSLSKLTLPHQLCRLFFLEQLYRSVSIIRGSSYHK
jgi:23S rRNA (pseudouridine1915-N3)-methyltransferase